MSGWVTDSVRKNKKGEKVVTRYKWGLLTRKWMRITYHNNVFFGKKKTVEYL